MTLPTLIQQPLGIAYHVPAEVYHSGPEISFSGLKLIERSPAHYKAERAKTRPLVVGSAYHTLILEPAEFPLRYITPPEWGWRSNADKAKWADFLCDQLLPDQYAVPSEVAKWVKDDYMAKFPVLTGKDFLDGEEHAALMRMQEVLGRHRTAIELVSRGRAEVSAYWIDEDTGCRCRCRADWYSADHIITDIKTTEDASEEVWRRQAGRMRYHMQNGMYDDGFKAAGATPEHFAFLVQEKTEPFAVAIYTLRPKDVQAGRDRYHKAMRTYARCLAEDRWPAYSPYPVEIELPAYAL